MKVRVHFLLLFLFALKLGAQYPGMYSPYGMSGNMSYGNPYLGGYGNYSSPYGMSGNMSYGNPYMGMGGYGNPYGGNGNSYGGYGNNFPDYRNANPLQYYNSIQMLPQNNQNPYGSPFYFNPNGSGGGYGSSRYGGGSRGCVYCYGDRFRSRSSSGSVRIEVIKTTTTGEAADVAPPAAPAAPAAQEVVATPEAPAPAPRNPPQAQRPAAPPSNPSPALRPNPPDKSEAAACETCQRPPTANSSVSAIQEMKSLTAVINQSDAHDAAYGMEKFWSATYQSCVGFDGPLATEDGIGEIFKGDEKMERDPKMGAEFVRVMNEKSPYHTGSFPSATAAQCKSLKNVPAKNGSVSVTPGFLYGGAYNFNKANNTIYHTRGADGKLLTSSTVTAGPGQVIQGASCSQAVSAAFYAAGLRFVKEGARGAPGFGSPLSTPNMSSVLTNVPPEDRCIDFIDYNKSFLEPLKRGDLFVMPKNSQDRNKAHHSFVVESVGFTEVSKGVTLPDPYGILKLAKDGKVKSAEQCENNISITSFNFTIIHNSAASSRVGFSRIHVREWLSDPAYASAPVKLALEQEGKKACEAYFLHKTGRSDQSGPKIRTFAVARHKSDDPQCVTTPMKVEGEECIRGCRGYK